MKRRILLLVLLPVASVVAAVGVSAPTPASIPSVWSPPTLSPVESGTREGGELRAQSILARNAFRATRRPAVLPDPVAPGGDTEAASDLSALRLVGVIGPPWIALLAGADGSSPVVRLAVGDSHGDYRLISVRERTVDFVGPSGPFTLELRPPW